MVIKQTPFSQRCRFLLLIGLRFSEMMLILIKSDTGHTVQYCKLLSQSGKENSILYKTPLGFTTGRRHPLVFSISSFLESEDFSSLFLLHFSKQHL